MAAKKKINDIRIDEDKKSTILKYSGIAVLVFALFSLVAVLSYLFTWQADQSLMSHPDMMDKGVEVSNWAGKLGYRWASFLVARCFGLGSFALVFLLGACAYRLYYWNRSIGLLRLSLLAITGTFLSSLFLSYCSIQFTADTFFGGGLGGDAGHAVVLWMENLFGPIVSALILIALIVAWMIMASGRFAHWFAAVQEPSKPLPVPEEQDEAEQDPVVDDEGGNEDESDGGHVPGDDVTPAVDGGSEVAEPSDPAQEEEPQTPKPEDAPDPDPVADPQTSDEDFELEVIEGENFAEDIQEELPRIDNRSELERFEFPSLDLLKDYAEGRHKVSQQELDINNNRIRATLQNYRIEIEKVTAVVGPTVTLYKVVPAPGVRVAAIENLHREIAMSLGASGVRVVTLPDSVGIEVPNSTPSIVPLKFMLNDDSFRNSTAELPVAIGYTITQEVKTFDLTDAPHLLVAGATKQGKSVGLNVIISSLLYAKHPTELKFVFIDPKMVEFTSYNSLLKHYLAVLPMAANEEEERKNAIVKTPKQAEQILNSLCIEMDERYNLLASAGVNDFKLYNEKYKDRHLLPTDGHKFLPYLVVVIDEYADLIMAGGPGQDAKKSAKNIEASIIRLAQKGRAAGIHVIIATQRPSVNVITGLIKANFPTRIAFRVLSGADSKTILDSTGAENLIGKGDMLYYAGVKMERIQCALVSMSEINKITKFIGDQTGWKKCCNTPYYLPMPESQDGESGGGTIDMQNIDPLFEDAARMVVNTRKGSTSDLQRRLGMGYARAGRVMDQLEAAGIVGPQEGSKPRQVLVTDILELDEILSAFVKDN
ncbi:MAG: DNA translocase FtsK 4TM domain-containing protein [Bacteroidales bacterium]|nr:DNA translocase FtsK 4TM domain-containing protein [Bacteroidales bacterium]MBP3663138.1 DNA translocase FtsK 4TM domain-containing protein [Bacteroidales bacterium]